MDPKSSPCQGPSFAEVSASRDLHSVVSNSSRCQANVLAEPPKPSAPLNLHPAEAFAQALLAQPSASPGDLLKLFDLLPHEPAPAAGRALAGGFSFGSGAWVHGNQVGLRNNTFSFPLSTRVFTRHVARHGPAHFQFSSIVVLDNVCTVAHRDSHNEPSSQNAVFGLPDFSGGEVWVQREGGLTPFVANGKSLLGDALPTRPGPAVFAARQHLRATLPWSGRRVVLVAYTTTQLDRLPPDSKLFACGLGFVFHCSASCLGS